MAPWTRNDGDIQPETGSQAWNNGRIPVIPTGDVRPAGQKTGPVVDKFVGMLIIIAFSPAPV